MPNSIAMTTYALQWYQANAALLSLQLCSMRWAILVPIDCLTIWLIQSSPQDLFTVWPFDESNWCCLMILSHLVFMNFKGMVLPAVQHAMITRGTKWLSDNVSNDHSILQCFALKTSVCTCYPCYQPSVQPNDPFNFSPFCTVTLVTLVDTLTLLP